MEKRIFRIKEVDGVDFTSENKLLQIVDAEIKENQKETNIVITNKEGTKLNQIKHEFVTVGESIAQVKRTTSASFTSTGSADSEVLPLFAACVPSLDAPLSLLPHPANIVAVIAATSIAANTFFFIVFLSFFQK